MYTPQMTETEEVLDKFNPSVMGWKYKHPVVIHRGTNGTGSLSHISIK